MLRELSQRRGDLRPIVGNDTMLDVELLSFQQLDQKAPALVLPLTRRDAVRDGDDRGPQSGSFVFSTRVTSDTDIPGSIAFAMS